MDPFIKLMNDCNYSYTAIPWKTNGRLGGMEPSLYFPCNVLHDSMDSWIAVIWKFHGKPMEGFLGIPWKMHGRFHRCSMECQWSFPRIFHGFCQVVQYLAKIHRYSPWVFHGILATWFCHGFSMVIPWNYDAMGSPWRTHGEFIWPKTRGKLMDFSHEIFMGYFCKGGTMPGLFCVVYAYRPRWNVQSASTPPEILTNYIER